MSPFSMACVYGLQDSIRVLLLQLNANINGLPSVCTCTYMICTSIVDCIMCFEYCRLTTHH